MMRESGFLPDIVFVEKTVSSAPLVRRILKKCSDVPRRIVRDRREVSAYISEEYLSNPVRALPPISAAATSSSTAR
jgi:hypothetical protein